MNDYKHYIRTDANGIVIHKFSDAFESPQQGDFLLHENAPRHAHQTVPYTITNDRGQYLYKIVGGQMVERSQQELDAEWAARPASPPSLEERLKSAENLWIEYLTGRL